MGETRKITTILALAIAFCLVFLAPMAPAAVFDVSNGVELWEALQEAAINGEDDVINLAAGTYDQYIPDPPVSFAKFSYGTISEMRSLTIQGGPGTTPEDVILDGHNNGFVLEIHEGTPADFPPPDTLPAINIIGLTLRNGNDPYQAGGLLVDSYFHHVTVRNCRIINNTSDRGSGGGARIFNRLGDLIFENNLVTDNVLHEHDITTGLGPATICEGAGVKLHHQGDVCIVRNNVIMDNQSVGDNGTGGGLYLAGWLCGSPGRIWNLVNNTIINNSARYGGGLFVNLHGTLNLYNNIIYDNESPAADPGPIDFWVAETTGCDEVYAYHNNFSRASAILNEDVGNLDVDPHFVGLYSLSETSPLVNQGTVLVPLPGLPETDFEGDPRTCLELPDIGADEWCDGAGELGPMPKMALSGERSLLRKKKSDLVTITISLLFLQKQDSVPWEVSQGPMALEQEQIGSEWWIFLKEAGQPGSLSPAWYLTQQGWQAQAAPYYVGALEPVQPQDITTFTPKELGLTPGMYEVWFGVDMEVDGKISANSMSSSGVYLHLVGNPELVRPSPQRPSWAGFPGMIQKGMKSLIGN